MGISIPDYHLRAKHDLPELRKKLKGKGHRIGHHEEELNLTAMIDIMSVIILFLIQNFSATGEVLLSNKDIMLPNAYHGSMMRRAPIVTVTPEMVTLEGVPSGDNSNLDQKIEESDWELPTLTKTLTDYKTFYETVAPGGGAVFPGEVIVQADSDLDFLYLKRVMFTLTKAGYANIMLAVRGNANVDSIGDTVGRAAEQLSGEAPPAPPPQ